MKHKRHIETKYIDNLSDTYFANVVNSNGNMLTIITVGNKSDYVPPYEDKYMNDKYMTDYKLICKCYKLNYTQYIYDVNFNLPSDVLDVTDDIVDEIIKEAFDVNFEAEK